MIYIKFKYADFYLNERRNPPKIYKYVFKRKKINTS